MTKGEYYAQVKDQFSEAYELYVESDYEERNYLYVCNLSRLLRSIDDYRNSYDPV